MPFLIFTFHSLNQLMEGIFSKANQGRSEIIAMQNYLKLAYLGNNFVKRKWNKGVRAKLKVIINPNANFFY